MDPMHELGTPLTLAVFRLAPDSQKEYAQDFERRFLRGQTSPTDASWIVFYTGLLQRIQDGECEAVGTRNGLTSVEIIPLTFMVDARPNFEAGSVEHAGVVYHGVRIRALSTDTSAERPKEARVVPSFSEANVRDWYIQRAKSYPTERSSSEKEDASDAEAQFGKSIPRDFLRRLRSQHGLQHWKKSGPRSG
jgi:hypothetical protein